MTQPWVPSKAGMRRPSYGPHPKGSRKPLTHFAPGLHTETGRHRSIILSTNRPGHEASTALLAPLGPNTSERILEARSPGLPPSPHRERSPSISLPSSPIQTTTKSGGPRKKPPSDESGRRNRAASADYSSPRADPGDRILLSARAPAGAPQLSRLVCSARSRVRFREPACLTPGARDSIWFDSKVPHRSSSPTRASFNMTTASMKLASARRAVDTTRASQERLSRRIRSLASGYRVIPLWSGVWHGGAEAK